MPHGHYLVVPTLVFKGAHGVVTVMV